MGLPSTQNSHSTHPRMRSRASTMRFVAASAGIALVIFAYYRRTWGSIAGFQAAIDTCAQPFCDFANFYYPMGEAVFHTGSPVRGFMYSPFIAILLAIFPPLGLNPSLVLWGILLALCVILYLLLFRQLVPAGLPVQLLFVALALTSFPLFHTLSWGQVSVFTTVAVLGMLVLLQRGQRGYAAILFAFAASFKFFPLIFIAPFAARRETRFLLFAAIACGAFLFIVPGLLLGVGDTLSFYGGLLDSFRDSDWVASNYNSQYFPHVLLRLASETGYDALNLLPLLSWISYGIATANLGLIFLIQRARLRHADLWCFHLLFLSIPFFLKTSWPVDLVFLSFAQALLAWQYLEGEEPAPAIEISEERFANRAWRKHNSPGHVTVMLLLLLMSIVISSIIFFNILSNRDPYGFFGFIFWADLLCLIVSYLVLLPPALRQTRLTPRLPFSRSPQNHI